VHHARQYIRGHVVPLHDDLGRQGGDLCAHRDGAIYFLDFFLRRRSSANYEYLIRPRLARERAARRLVPPRIPVPLLASGRRRRSVAVQQRLKYFKYFALKNMKIDFAVSVIRGFVWAISQGFYYPFAICKVDTLPALFETYRYP
jgi:hypothetical protein